MYSKQLSIFTHHFKLNNVAVKIDRIANSKKKHLLGFILSKIFIMLILILK